MNMLALFQGHVTGGASHATAQKLLLVLFMAMISVLVTCHFKGTRGALTI